MIMGARFRIIFNAIRTLFIFSSQIIKCNIGPSAEHATTVAADVLMELPTFGHICTVNDNISFAGYTIQSTIFARTWDIYELWFWTPF